MGTKAFSVQQFANDTFGLLEALKIQKADVLGYSLGSFVAQQLTVTHQKRLTDLYSLLRRAVEKKLCLKTLNYNQQTLLLRC
jgi:pimeloyl-ACP methyl ester carboxylesterase